MPTSRSRCRWHMWRTRRRTHYRRQTDRVYPTSPAPRRLHRRHRTDPRYADLTMTNRSQQSPQPSPDPAGNPAAAQPSDRVSSTRSATQHDGAWPRATTRRLRATRRDTTTRPLTYVRSLNPGRRTGTHQTDAADEVMARTKCRAENRTALSASNRGNSLCLPESRATTSPSRRTRRTTQDPPRARCARRPTAQVELDRNGDLLRLLGQDVGPVPAEHRRSGPGLDRHERYADRSPHVDGPATDRLVDADLRKVLEGARRAWQSL